MATTVDFHHLARAEIRRVRSYYGRVGYGARFFAALQDAIAAITASPGIGSPDLFGTRYIRLRKFPYRLVYIEEPTRVLVLAVPHNSRRPGYWSRRLP